MMLSSIGKATNKSSFKVEQKYGEENRMLANANLMKMVAINFNHSFFKHSIALIGGKIATNSRDGMGQ